MSNQPASQSNHCTEEGIALPLVLVSMAVLALIAFAGFETVSRAGEDMRKIDYSIQMDLALQSAEETAIFSYVTGQAAPGGIYLGSDVEIEQESLMGFDFSELNPDRIWSANGETRIVDVDGTRVVVAFWDGTALLSMEFMSLDQLAAYFEGQGASEDDAERWAALIDDYQDEDNIRQFRGGERSDYRLRLLPPPTNAPIRTPEELGNLLEIRDRWSQTLVDGVTSTIRFAGAPRYPADGFADPAIVSLYADDRQEDDLIDGVMAHNWPSSMARFELSVSSPIGTRTRIIDVERTRSNASKPFRRYWVSDQMSETVLPSDTLEEMPNVLDTE